MREGTHNNDNPRPPRGPIADTLSYLLLPDGRSPLMDLLHSNPVLKASMLIAYPELSGAPELARKFVDDDGRTINHILTLPIEKIGEIISSLDSEDAKKALFIFALTVHGFMPGDVNAQTLQARGNVSVSVPEQKDLIQQLLQKIESETHTQQSPAWEKAMGLDPASFQCMVDNVYHEARGEQAAGQKGVVAVTLNRVARAAKRLEKNPEAKSVCGVVYEPKQFSWTNDPRLASAPKEPKTYAAITKLIQDISEGKTLPQMSTDLNQELGLTEGTIFYVRTDFYNGALFGNKTISPGALRFFQSLEKVGDPIGNHTFFRLPSSARLPASQSPSDLSKPELWEGSLKEALRAIKR